MQHTLTFDRPTPITKDFFAVRVNPTGEVVQSADALGNIYPFQMEVAHQSVGRGNAIRDRHMTRTITYGLDINDVASVATEPLRVQLLVDKPRSGRYDAGAVAYAMQLLFGSVRTAWGTTGSNNYDLGSQWLTMGSVILPNHTPIG